MGLLMGMALCTILFYACAQDIPGEPGRPSIVPVENDEGEPEPRPRVYEVRITFTNEASISHLDATYTSEDFPEVPLWRKTSELSLDIRQRTFQNLKDNGREAEFRTGISFKTWVNSREQMIEVLSLLNEREDVESTSSWDLRFEIALELAYEKHGVDILDAETKWQIQQDLWEGQTLRYPDVMAKIIVTPEEYFDIPRYYGTYNGYVVIVPTGAYKSITGMMWATEIIDDIRFDEPIAGMLYHGIIVWKDGSLSTMTVLYEQGVLTREDLLTIKDTYDRVWEAVGEALKNT
jgi:hypothetical protein